MEPNKYFDSFIFGKIIDIIKTHPYEALNKFEEYLNIYNKDYYAYTMYITLLINLEEYDKAKELLKKIDSSYKNSYNNDIKRIESTKESLIYCKLKLLIQEEKYEEFLKFYNKHANTLTSYEIGSGVINYCKKKLNIIDEDLINPTTYLFEQISHYSEENFYEHIKKHMAEYNKDLDTPNENIFVEHLPIRKIVDETKKYIPSKKRVCYGFIDDTYLFKYNGCGKYKNKYVDYIKMICFHNTCDFITMVPVKDGEYYPYIDLNYLNDDIIIKKKSQIDKFNKKYGINRK